MVVPEELEMRLPFLEEYKKTRMDKLNEEEFNIKKGLETAVEAKRDYIKESILPGDHMYRTDYKHMA